MVRSGAWQGGMSKHSGSLMWVLSGKKRKDEEAVLGFYGGFIIVIFD